MMDATSFNEEDPVQQHSLPEPERRKPYNASTVGRRKRIIRIAIWSIAGLLIIIVIAAFSLAIVKSTYPSVEDSTRDNSPAANEADMPSEDEGGFDFDYGGVGGVKDSLSYDDFSYSSADEGGSYNKDYPSTQEPTYFPTDEPTYEPTGEPTWDEAHLGLPTFEPTMGVTEESTNIASTETSTGITEEVSEELTSKATDHATNDSSRESNKGISDFDQDFSDFSISASYAQNSPAGIGVDVNKIEGNEGGDSDRDGRSSFLLGGNEISSYSAAQGARQRRRRLYRHRRRVLRQLSKEVK